MGDDGRRLDVERLLQLDAAPDGRRRSELRHAGRHDRRRCLGRHAGRASRRASPGEDQLCEAKLAPGSAAAGKIVACERGTNARIDKGFNVFSGGAAGMILYNPVAEDVETDDHWLPAIHVDGPSAPLLAFIGGHTNVKASWAQGVESPTKGDVMATFSARGPSRTSSSPT